MYLLNILFKIIANMTALNLNPWLELKKRMRVLKYFEIYYGHKIRIRFIIIMKILKTFANLDKLS